MSKIIGAKIKENFKYQREDGTEAIVNSVEFRCITPAIGDDNLGSDICKYTAQISDLKYIFKNFDEAVPLRDFVESVLGVECILETKSQASKFGVVDKLVQVHFIK